jgi:hypothetical protein
VLAGRTKGAVLPDVSGVVENGAPVIGLDNSVGRPLLFIASSDGA